MRAALALLVVCVSSCAADPPVLTSVEPPIVSQAAAAQVKVHGRNLASAVELSLDDDTSAHLDTRWGLQIGDTSVAAADVALVDPQTLSALVPAGLPVGKYDVVAISPRGERARLAGGLRVVAFDPAGCGDGQCLQGEDTCNCPADCGAGTCGDGICCAQTGETRCTCARDCGGSTCGDGCCGAAELLDGTCPGDCVCGRCDAGCGNGCCADQCTASPCRPVCGCAACQLDCNGVDVCAPNCNGAHACAIDCRGVNDCSPTCSEGATCNVRCDQKTTCAIHCSGADCDITCDNANKCNDAHCINDARCVLRCKGGASCSFAECDGGQMSCPGKTVTCNRPCP